MCEREVRGEDGMNRMSGRAVDVNAIPDILFIPSSSLLQADFVQGFAQYLGRVEQGRLLALVEREVQRLLRTILADHPRDREGDILDAQVAAIQPRRHWQDAL